MKRSYCAILALVAFMPMLSGCGRDTLDDEGIRGYSAAVSAYQAGDFERAIDLASAVLGRFPGFAKGYVLQGKSHWFSGRGEEALAVLERALAKDPEDQEARLWKVRILRSMGRADEAEASLDPLLSRDPEDFRLLHLKAMALLDKGNTQAGIAFLDKALESGAELALSYLERGRVAYLLGQREDALEFLETAKALSKGSPATGDAIDILIASISAEAEK